MNIFASLSWHLRRNRDSRPGIDQSIFTVPVKAFSGIATIAYLVVT